MTRNTLDLKTATHLLEDAIITLSGPALAVSGILAGVDLLTGGHAMIGLPWLTLTWAITLMLTLDFQVLTLGVRAKRIYLSDTSKKRKAAEIVLTCLIAASIAFVSIQMQSIIARSNGVGISVEQATLQLGISPLALIWERSALVLFLIFLAGWFRDMTPVPPETPPPLSDETMRIILTKLEKLDALEQAVTAPIAALPPADVPLLEAPESSGIPETEDGTEGETSSLEARLERLLVTSPAITVRDAATIVGKPPSTVGRYLSRLRQ